MTKEEIASEVLSALKAEEILERIEAYLKKPSGNMVSKKELLDIIQKGEEADEYYT